MQTSELFKVVGSAFMKIGTTKVDFDLPPSTAQGKVFWIIFLYQFWVKGQFGRMQHCWPKSKAAPNHSTIFKKILYSQFFRQISVYSTDFQFGFQFYPKDLKIKTLKPNILTLLCCMVLALLDLFERILLRQLVVLGNALS